MRVDRPAVYAISIVLPILSLLTVTGRFHGRRKRKAKFGMDDWFAFAGVIGVLTMTAIGLQGTKEGIFGTHSENDPKTHALITKWQDQKNVEYHWIVVLLSIITITFIKLSVIFLYRRIFTMSKVFDIYSIVLIVVTIAYGVAFFFGELFWCGRRITIAWTTPKEAKAHCSDTKAIFVAICVTDLIVDLLILLAPVPMVWKLVATPVRRLQILAIFAIGYLAIAGSATRSYISIVDAYKTPVGFRDIRNTGSLILVWSVVEVNAALIGSSLPTVGHIFSIRGIESAVNSIRSALSLHSLRSHTSDTRQEEDGIALARPEAAMLPV